MALCKFHVLVFLNPLGSFFTSFRWCLHTHSLINTLLNIQRRPSEQPPEFLFCALSSFLFFVCLFSFIFFCFSSSCCLYFPQNFPIIVSTQGICNTLLKFSLCAMAHKLSHGSKLGNVLTLFLMSQGSLSFVD